MGEDVVGRPLLLDEACMENLRLKLEAEKKDAEITKLRAEVERLNRCYDRAMAGRLEWRHEAEKAEARASAIREEAAKCAESYQRKVIGRDLEIAQFDPAGRWEGGAIYDAPTIQSGIAQAIRSLELSGQREAGGGEKVGGDGGRKQQD